MNVIIDILNIRYFCKVMNKIKYYLYDILFLFLIINKMNLMDY